MMFRGVRHTTLHRMFAKIEDRIAGQRGDHNPMILFSYLHLFDARQHLFRDDKTSSVTLAFMTFISVFISTSRIPLKS